MSKPFLTVIIPTSNNARTLPLALIDVDHHLSRMEVLTEIIIVDDHSTDATAEIARRFRMLLGNIRLMVAYDEAILAEAVKIKGVSIVSAPLLLIDLKREGGVAIEGYNLLVKQNV